MNVMLYDFGILVVFPNLFWEDLIKEMDSCYLLCCYGSTSCYLFFIFFFGIRLFITWETKKLKNKNPRVTKEWTLEKIYRRVTCLIRTLKKIKTVLTRYGKYFWSRPRENISLYIICRRKEFQICRSFWQLRYQSQSEVIEI